MQACTTYTTPNTAEVDQRARSMAVIASGSMPPPPRANPYSRSLPVTRSNLPPHGYGTPASMHLPPQAIMYLTPQQLAAQSQARAAWIQQEQERARLAYAHMHRHHLARSVVNQNGKRPGDQPQLYTGGPEFGALVPERLRQSHGQFLRPQFESGVTPRLPGPHLLSPDLMDALHIADKGLFLACDAGMHYYIWRYAIRLDNPHKHVDSNMLGNIEPFFISIPNDPMQKSDKRPEIASSYCFLYRSWDSIIMKGGGFDRLFGRLAGKMGLVNQEQCARAQTRIKSFFHRAKQIWNKTPFQPEDALCYLRASEEFWWVDEDLPEEIEPKPATQATQATQATSTTPTKPESPNPLEDAANGAFECLHKHGIDAKSPDKYFGHLDRSIAIWSQSRKTTTSWAPRCNKQPDTAADNRSNIQQKGQDMSAEQVWTHHVKSNTLYDKIGYDRFMKSTEIGQRPMSMKPVERNVHYQAVQWLYTVGPEADRHNFIFFDHEKAFKDGLCAEAWSEPKRRPTGESAHDAIDVDSDMDAEGEDDIEPPAKRTRMDSTQDLMASSSRLDTFSSSSTRHGEQLSDLKSTIPLSSGDSQPEVTVVRKDSGTQEMLHVEMTSPGLTNTMSPVSPPVQNNSMLSRG